MPGTWKKFITGKGNSDKVKTMRVIQEKYNLQPENFDESDAIGILKWAEAEYGETK